MKFLMGIFAMFMIMFVASVSFASDGPETTKECVVYADVGPPTIDLDINIFAETVDAGHIYIMSVIESVTILEDNKIITTELTVNQSNLHVDPGRSIKANVNYNYTDYTGAKYKFLDKSNRIRML